MPRKPRQFEIGNIYHIINRGVDGRDTFLKNQDYSRFILGLEFFNTKNSINIWSLITRAVAGSDPATAAATAEMSIRRRLENQRANMGKPIVEIMAFTLMPNHYHLILREIIAKGISLFMQKIGGYSIYFNKQNDRSGSLFQSRYKCVEIKSDAQLFAVFTYVHTNPVELIEPMWKNQQVKNFVKAKNFLENYKWSSYQDYIGKPMFPNVISKEFFLNFFGKEKNCKKEVENWIEFKAKNYIQNNKFNPKIFE